MEWLESLKQGDEVAIRRGYGYRAYEIATVERTTPKQILLKGLRFWRESGQLVGESFTPIRLVELTAEIREQVKRESYISKLKAVVWERIDTETLENVIAALQPSTAKCACHSGSICTSACDEGKHHDGCNQEAGDGR